MTNVERPRERGTNAEPESAEIAAWAKNLAAKIKNGLSTWPEFKATTERLGYSDFFSVGSHRLGEVKFTKGNHRYTVVYGRKYEDEWLEFHKEFPKKQTKRSKIEKPWSIERIVLATGPSLTSDRMPHVSHYIADSNGRGAMEFIGGFGSDNTRWDIAGAREFLSVVFDRPTPKQTLKQAS